MTLLSFNFSFKKYSFLVLALVFMSSISFAQPNSTYKPENEGWLVKLEEAYKESKNTGKPILANFTGSDWCGWCKKLTKSVFSKKEFKTWAKKNVILLELDFPKRFRLPQEIAQQNQGLKQAFGVKGFPTVWVFDLDKNDVGQYNIRALGKTGYSNTAGEFTGGIDKMIANKK